MSLAGIYEYAADPGADRRCYVCQAGRQASESALAERLAEGVRRHVLEELAEIR
jgi:hypothetical protein